MSRNTTRTTLARDDGKPRKAASLTRRREASVARATRGGKQHNQGVLLIGSIALLALLLCLFVGLSSLSSQKPLKPLDTTPGHGGSVGSSAATPFCSTPDLVFSHFG